MNTSDICKHCGGERGLHHYETDQCPVGGREAPFGKVQEWKKTTFETETTDDMVIELIKKNLRISVSRERFDETILNVSLWWDGERIDSETVRVAA